MVEDSAYILCRKCNNPLEQQTKFCRYCGALVEGLADETNVATSSLPSVSEQVSANSDKHESVSDQTLAKKESDSLLPSTEPVLPAIIIASDTTPVITSQFSQAGVTSQVIVLPMRPLDTPRRTRRRWNRYFILVGLLTALFVAITVAGLLTYNYIKPKPLVKQTGSLPAPIPIPAAPVAAPTPTLVIDNASSLLEAGKTDLMAGRINEAIEKLDRSIALDKTQAEAHKVRGDALVKASRYEEALASYEQAVILNGKYFDAYSGLAQTAERLGWYKKAEKAYYVLLTLKSDETALRLQLARVLARQGQWASARDNYEKVIKADPNGELGLAASNELAKLKELGRPNTASPDDHNGSNAIASNSATNTTKSVDTAKTVKTTSASESNLNAGQRVSKGIKLAEQGDLTAALKEYQTALSQQPNNHDIYYLMGLVYERMEQPENALKAYQRCQSGPYVNLARQHVTRLEKKLHKKP
ncbi:MAG: tetratricopeptide repeat protein [Acidobacteriota bacterium]